MIRMIIPAQLDQLADVSQRFETALSGYAGDDVMAVTLAVQEILVNIIEHSYAGEGGEIELAYTLKRNRLDIEIIDTGFSFEPKKVPEPVLGTLQEGGFGLFLVAQLMDKATYTQKRNQNRWQLRKKLSR